MSEAWKTRHKSETVARTRDYAIDFAVHSAILKFYDHIPLERQERMMARQNLVVTSQTLWDQQAALTKH